MAAPPGYDLTEAPAVDGLRAAKNTGVSAIPAKRLVKGGEQAIALPTATTDPCYGVTYTEAPAGGYGTVATRGRVVLTAGAGGVTKDQRIMPEANTGKGIPWSAGAGVNAGMAGIAQTTAAQDLDFVIELSAPGIVSQG